MEFCKWHGKELKDVHEHEQQQCFDSGDNCMNCVYLSFDKDDEEEE